MPKKGRVKINLPRKKSRLHLYKNKEKQNQIVEESVTQNKEDNIVSGNDEEILYFDDAGAKRGVTTEMDNTGTSDGQESPGPTLTDPYDCLKQELRIQLISPYELLSNSDCITIVELYNSSNPSVKLSICIDRDFIAKLFVHKIQVNSDHDFWLGLPRVYSNINDVIKLLSKLRSFSVCIGNPDEEWQDLVPVGVGLSEKAQSIAAYREGDFGAVKGDITYTSTIRSVRCQFLVQGARCGQCSTYRRTLRRRKQSLEEKQNQSRDYVTSFCNHRYYTREDFINKINQQKSKIDTLQQNIQNLKQRFEREMSNDGVELDHGFSAEMSDFMKITQGDMFKAFPDPNSLQRLFWEQQLKMNAVKTKNGMRWHPMIIRWCLYLRHKSASAYDAIRNSGFIRLPSSRTLYDYSHFTSSKLGLNADVAYQLKEQAEKLGMIDNKQDPWKCFVGVLFDEIKVKSGLVYDKNTGELIGYTDLDKVGNQIVEFENFSRNSKHDVAKHMLVVMVRGVATELAFPVAGFATTRTSADFIYPIVWKVISVLETFLSLKVLFCTCDGASANRRFFTLHGDGNNEFVYFTINPHDPNRKVFFISDVPHLIKTTRNCFSNSHSHKRSRKLWKNGKDISWMHIVQLYEDHCEMQYLTPCPNLKRAHIDLTAFSCMKVNLAAQIFSQSVANAIEMLYDDSHAETVKFIKIMNKFFDCLNVRHIFEGRNKRNPDLNAYSDIHDPRLHWLQHEFLQYFIDWEHSIDTETNNLTSSEKRSMMLSHQTVMGLKISVNSIIECVKFMLTEGANFVLTYNFNQDPLEQLFSHVRQKCGSNRNPTIQEAKQNLNQIRTIGAIASASTYGNTKVYRYHHDQIDHSKLNRRPRH